MDFGSTLLGIIGGALGGVLAAGPIARGGEVARERLKAEREIQATLAALRDTLRFDRENGFRLSSTLSTSSVSQIERERLVRAVLEHVDSLRRSQRDTVIGALGILVGEAELDWAQSYLYAPAASTEDSQAKQTHLVKALHQRKTPGLLAAFPGGSDQEKATACDASVSLLDGVIYALAPGENALTRVWRVLTTG